MTRELARRAGQATSRAKAAAARANGAKGGRLRKVKMTAPTALAIDELDGETLKALATSRMHQRHYK